MGVEPLVLGADESVPHVLGNGGDVHRNTLGLVADLVDRNPLVILVLGVDIRVVGQLHFFDGDVGNIIPEMHDIDHQRRCHDGACDDENEEEGDQRRAENGQRPAERRKPFRFGNALVQFRCVVGIFRRSCGTVVLSCCTVGCAGFRRSAFSSFLLLFIHGILVPSEKSMEITA